MDEEFDIKNHKRIVCLVKFNKGEKRYGCN